MYFSVSIDRQSETVKRFCRVQNHWPWAREKKMALLCRIWSTRVKTGHSEHMSGMVPGLGSVIGCPRPITRRRWRGDVFVHHKCLGTLVRLTRFSVGVMGASRSASPGGGRRTL